MLGGHTEDVCLAAYNYGRHLGLAFQLIDDALDFRASSDTLGKVILTLETTAAWAVLYATHTADARSLRWLMYS